MRRFGLPLIRTTLALAALLGAGIPAAQARFDLGSVLLGGGQSLGVESIIRNLVDQGRSTDFAGTQVTVVYRPERRTSTQRITQSGGRRRIEYLSPPELRGKEIYVEGGKSVSPVGGILSPEIGLVGDLGRLAKRMIGSDTIAGRPALIVEMRTPGGGGSRKVWVDKEKWVPLKWEDHDAGGALLSTTTFTDIRFGGLVPQVAAPRGFAPSVQPVPVRSLAEAEDEAGFRPLSPAHLPKGYRQQAVTVSSFGAHQQAKRVTVVYSSGLGVITLIEAPAQVIRHAPRPGEVLVSALGQLVWVSNNVHCVLRATPPLSVEEMKRIAASVK